MKTVQALILAFLLGEPEAMAQDAQIGDKPIETAKERINRVYSRVEFQTLVLGKTEEQILQLLGQPDQVLRLGGLCFGVCLGEDFFSYRIRVKDPGFEQRMVWIAINAWTGVTDGISFDPTRLPVLGP